MSSNVMLIFAMILWGIWGFADKNAVTRTNPFVVQWMYSIPYAIFIPLWYWLGLKTAPVSVQNLWQGFAWAALASISSMLALLLLLFALKLRPASIAVAITSAYPVVTLLIAVMSGTEIFSLQKGVGIFLVVAGVFLLQLG